MNSISKINENLFLGPFECSYNLSEEFKKLEINVIVNCCSEIRYNNKTKYTLVSSENSNDEFNTLFHSTKLLQEYLVLTFPLENNEDEFLFDRNDEIDVLYERLEFLIQNNQKIYFHCVKGDSRSPAVLMYFLMIYYNKTFDDAFDMVVSAREIVHLSNNFISELQTLCDYNKIISDIDEKPKSDMKYEIKIVQNDY